MALPKSEAEEIVARLVAAQRSWRADEMLRKRAERAARQAEPAMRDHLLALVAALRYDEHEAMRRFSNAARLSPGDEAIAWNRAATAAMFGRWARARALFAEVANRFGNPNARKQEISMLRFCGCFREAARLAQAHGLQTPDAMLAELAEWRGLDEARVAALFERVGAFLRAHRLPVLGESMSVVDADEELIEALIFTPAREPLDEAFVDYMSRFDPLPKEEASILIGFEPADADAVARAA